MWDPSPVVKNVPVKKPHEKYSYKKRKNKSGIAIYKQRPETDSTNKSIPVFEANITTPSLDSSLVKAEIERTTSMPMSQSVQIPSGLPIEKKRSFTLNTSNVTFGSPL